MPVDTQAAIKQIDLVLDEWRILASQSQKHDLSDVSEEKQAKMFFLVASTMKRLAPQGSFHRDVVDRMFTDKNVGFFFTPAMIGALEALKSDYSHGHLQSIEELVHANMFQGFLEMASHLHSSGYKDAGAVIAGSVLEQHLRELCQKNGIPVIADSKWRKANALNSALASAGVYSKLNEKNVTAWLGLRNDAAHGNYANYSPQQAKLMIDAVGEFMVRHPA
jgi:hypothetical protein